LILPFLFPLRYLHGNLHLFFFTYPISLLTIPFWRLRLSELPLEGVECRAKVDGWPVSLLFFFLIIPLFWGYRRLLSCRCVFFCLFATSQLSPQPSALCFSVFPSYYAFNAASPRVFLHLTAVWPFRRTIFQEVCFYVDLSSVAPRSNIGENPYWLRSSFSNPAKVAFVPFGFHLFPTLRLSFFSPLLFSFFFPPPLFVVSLYISLPFHMAHVPPYSVINRCFPPTSRQLSHLYAPSDFPQSVNKAVV